jgi:hypothetical protein
MDGQGYGFHLNSDREVSAFLLEIQLANSKKEASAICSWFALSEEDFIRGFPDLAQRVQELPD